jgi:hypothetical protein
MVKLDLGSSNPRVQLTVYLSVLVKLLAEARELSIDIVVGHGECMDALYWFGYKRGGSGYIVV